MCRVYKRIRPIAKEFVFHTLPVVGILHPRIHSGDHLGLSVSAQTTH